MRALLLLPLLLSSAALADPVQDVLTHPAIVAIGQLTNAQHGGQCKLPTTGEDIQWGCTGALMPVEKPTIQGVPCFFFVRVACPGETTTISGTRQQYYLLMPDSTVAQKTSPEIIIDLVAVGAG
jgi:hypothetical protein